MSQDLSCPLVTHHEVRRPLMIGALGTSLTWGADLPDSRTQAWPVVLQRQLSGKLDRSDIFLLNGALRATSADFAALCFDELWGPAWKDSRGLSRPPRLDLAIIEYNWSSSPSQMAALIEAMHARGIPCVAILYYHPVNVGRLGRVKNDPTPWKGANNAGHHRTFARVFEHHGVPFINTSVLNARYGHRAMLNTTRGIWSAAHLSPLGHEGIASQLTSLLLTNCTEAFRLPPPPSPGATDEYFCRIGSSLNSLRIADAVEPSTSGGSLVSPARVKMAGHTDPDRGSFPRGPRTYSSTQAGDHTAAWEMLVPSDGRTPGLLTTSVNSTLQLLLPQPMGGRFLSLGIEASHKTDGAVHVSCAGTCICAPFDFDAHSRKKYTYLQRTKPVWISPTHAANLLNASLPNSLLPRCELFIVATRLNAGRLMLKAVTMSSPRPGNRSVSVSSLYALQ